MRLFMLLGAMLGFVIGLAAGFHARNAWPVVLWHAALCALGLGLLARWWAGIWQSSLRQAITEQVARNEAKRAEAKTSATNNKS